MCVNMRKFGVDPFGPVLERERVVGSKVVGMWYFFLFVLAFLTGLREKSEEKVIRSDLKINRKSEAEYKKMPGGRDNFHYRD